MGSKGSPPASPDYANLIPIQERSNINQFNTMLGASRINSQTPYGSMEWVRPSGFGAAPAPTPSQPSRGPEPERYTTGTMPAFGDNGGGGFQTQVENPQWTQWNQQGGGGDGSFRGVDNVYGGAAGSDPWTLIQRFSPEQQALYDQDLRIRSGQGNIAERMMGNVGQTYGAPANFAQNLPQFQYGASPDPYQMQGYRPQQYQQQQYMGPQYFSNMNSREDAERAIMNRQMRYITPDFAGREEQLHNRLTAQGFNVNDPGYKQAMDSFQSQRDRAMADARDQAILGGGQEATQELQRAMSAALNAFTSGQSESMNRWNTGTQNQMNLFNTGTQNQMNRFNTQLAGQQFQAQQQQNALNYALQQMQAQERDRARQLNELNAFRTGQQVQLPGTPGQTSVPNLQGIDQVGMANQNYQNQLGAYNAQQASGGNFMKGLFDLGGAVLGGPAGSAGAQLGSWLAGMSDRRLKTNITKIGQTPGGNNLYLWDWIDGSGPSTGVIAQEVPEAAFVGPDGFLMVDYGKVR